MLVSKLCNCTFTWMVGYPVVRRSSTTKTFIFALLSSSLVPSWRITFSSAPLTVPCAAGGLSSVALPSVKTGVKATDGETDGQTDERKNGGGERGEQEQTTGEWTSCKKDVEWRGLSVKSHLDEVEGEGGTMASKRKKRLWSICRGSSQNEFNVDLWATMDCVTFYTQFELPSLKTSELEYTNYVLSAQSAWRGFGKAEKIDFILFHVKL